MSAAASALYAGHRIFFDHDHILPDLRNRFDEVLSDLENGRRLENGASSASSFHSWLSRRHRHRRSPVAPLSTARNDDDARRHVRHPASHPTRNPAIKAFLCLDRNATRDYLHLAAFASYQGFDAAAKALTTMDDLYPQANGDKWAVRTQLVKQLADPRPYDLDTVDLAEYKGIQAPLNQWDNFANIAGKLSDRLTHEFAEQMKAAPPL